MASWGLLSFFCMCLSLPSRAFLRPRRCTPHSVVISCACGSAIISLTPLTSWPCVCCCVLGLVLFSRVILTVLLCSCPLFVVLLPWPPYVVPRISLLFLRSARRCSCCLVGWCGGLVGGVNKCCYFLCFPPLPPLPLPLPLSGFLLACLVVPPPLPLGVP